MSQAAFYVKLDEPHRGKSTSDDMVRILVMMMIMIMRGIDPNPSHSVLGIEPDACNVRFKLRSNVGIVIS